jgi:hypothetical protein
MIHEGAAGDPEQNRSVMAIRHLGQAGLLAGQKVRPQTIENPPLVCMQKVHRHPGRTCGTGPWKANVPEKARDVPSTCAVLPVQINNTPPFRVGGGAKPVGGSDGKEGPGAVMAISSVLPSKGRPKK